MSITAVCPSCRKQLNVRDEFLGKRLKCPGCGNTFTADASTAAASTMPSKRGGAAPGKTGERVPRVHVSPAVIIFAAVVVAIPTIFFVWRAGPGRVRGEWARLQPVASDDVTDVVTRAIQAHLSQRGFFDPGKQHRAPQALDVTFVFSPMPWSMPDAVGFAGTSTQGAFVGKYHPHTGEVEADVEVGGLSLPGAGVAKRGDVTLKVTGRNKNGNVTVEIDGKQADLVYRETPDD